MTDYRLYRRDRHGVLCINAFSDPVDAAHAFNQARGGGDNTMEIAVDLRKGRAWEDTHPDGDTYVVVEQGSEAWHALLTENAS